MCKKTLIKQKYYIHCYNLLYNILEILINFHKAKLKVGVRMEVNHSGRSTWKTILRGALVLAIWASIILGLVQLGLYEYSIFHTTVELFTIVISFVVFVIVINTYEISQNKFIAFLGISFAFIALLDLLHSFTHDGINIIGFESLNISAQLWISARWVQCISILAAFILYKALRLNINNNIVIAVYLVIVSSLIAVIFYFKIFPDCYIEGVGSTDFKRISEYIIAGLLFIGVILIVKNRDGIKQKLYRNVLLFMLLTIASGLILTMDHSHTQDVAIAGHILKFLAYWFFYCAIVVTSLKSPINHMFYELAEKNLEIIRSNDQLKQDIADLQMIEKLLRKSKAWSRAIFEGSSIGIVLLNVNGIIIEANPAFEKILGYNSEELRDLGIQNITHPEDYDQDMKLFNDLINGIIDSYNIEKRYMRKDNAVIWCNLKMSYIFNAGEDFQFIIAMLEDVTQRKQDEERRAQLLKELETTNQELDNFAYIVSHDLKAPLRGIGSLANWLLNDYSDKMDTEGKDIIGLMINRVERMKNFIDGILQYSRLSRANENLTMVDLNKVVDEALELISMPDNIRVEIENKLPEISCYKLFAEQIFQNLLSNAVKFMDKPKGVIRISAEEEEGFWKICIADNGAGIDEKYYKKIFQIFQTLQPRDKFESTGIGLSIVKKIVETCGGRIWVESEPGKGSEFYFTLPKRRD